MSNIRRLLFASSTVLAVVFGVTILAHAQSQSCHLITGSSQTPTGYASPVSFFGGSLLIKGDCNAGSIAVTVGNGEPTTYIYDKSYLWTGSQWQAKTLTGSNKQGVWIPEVATTNLTSSQSPTYYVAYTCEWVNQAWKCGCTTSSCTTNQWQIQIFQPTSGNQGGGDSTGDGTSQGGAGTYTGNAELITPATGASGTLRQPDSSDQMCINSPTHNYLKSVPIAESRAPLKNITPCSQRYQVHWKMNLQPEDVGDDIVTVLNRRHADVRNDYQMYGSGTDAASRKRAMTVGYGPGNIIAIQRNVEPGVVPSSSFRFNNFPNGVQAACLSMQVYIPSDFVGNKAGYKLGYGFFGGPRGAGGGTSPVRQEDMGGFVVRNTWNGKTTGLYSYHLNRGESGRWQVQNEPKCDSSSCCIYGDSSAQGTVPKGKWVRIEEEVVMNTGPNRFDGYSRLWVDGKQAGEITGQTFGDMPLRGLLINDMWGGNIRAVNNQATKNEKYWLADYVVYK